MSKPRSGDVVDAETGEVLGNSTSGTATKPAGTPADRVPTERKDPPAKIWVVVRIVEYRIQALVFDGESALWEDVSRDTWMTDDREDAYQAARSHRGLLLSTNGLPSSRQLASFNDAVSAKRFTIAKAAGKSDEEAAAF